MQLPTRWGGVQRADLLQRDEESVTREQRASHGAGGRRWPVRKPIQCHR